MNANEMTFGVELETIIPRGICTIGFHGNGVQVPWLPQGWLADADPSIRPENPAFIGCEFVSPILKGAEGLKQLIEVIAELKRRGAQVNVSCGLHIHVGFDRSNAEALERLVTLVSNFEKAIFASTGTKRREQGRWTRGVQGYGNAQNAVNQSAMSRYHVLNLQTRKPTVEFRAFAGTLNAIKIVGYVRMCLGLVERALVAKRSTNWRAPEVKESSPIHRGGEGATALNRLFYQLGWTKGRTNHVYGDVTAENAPTAKQIKEEFVRLANKYDQA